MKNKIKVGLVSSLTTLAFLGSVLTTHAAAFSTSTAITEVNNQIGDVALIIGGTVAVILGLLSALLGLGWGVRHFKKYVTGKKF